MEPKVSVIVPVYNTSKYLIRCIDSLINQTLKDIEIILLNDGSTDDSLKILREYEEKDFRIKVIDKENEGVSETRNKGISLATGEYLSFVDSDDWIDENMISKLYMSANENNCDIVMCTYRKEYENGGKDRLLAYRDIEVLEGEKLENFKRRIVGPIGEEIRDPSSLDSLSISCGRLYRTELIKRNNVKYTDMKTIGNEDCLFNVRAFNSADKAIYFNKPLYHYWKGNENSLTTVHKRDLENKWENLYKVMSQFLTDNKREKGFHEALNNRICLSTLGLIINECSDKEKSPTKKVKAIKKTLHSDYIKEAFKEFNLEYLPIHWRLFYFFNKHKIAFMSYFMGTTINHLRRYA